MWLLAALTRLALMVLAGTADIASIVQSIAECYVANSFMADKGPWFMVRRVSSHLFPVGVSGVVCNGIGLYNLF